MSPVVSARAARLAPVDEPRLGVDDPVAQLVRHDVGDPEVAEAHVRVRRAVIARYRLRVSSLLRRVCARLRAANGVRIPSG